MIELCAIMTNIDDSNLLELLRKNSRLSISDLARALGCARGTVQARLTRLEASGAIQGYTIKTGGQAEGIQAYVAITLSPHIADEARTERALRHLPHVKALYSVAGPHDWLARVAAADPHRLDEAIDAIRLLPGVLKTVSQIILSTKFER